MECQHGIELRETTSVDFFVIQVFGIILEDLVQAMTRKCFPKMDPEVKRWIGYLWVAAFLLELTPVWIYPQHYKLSKSGQAFRFLDAERNGSLV